MSAEITFYHKNLGGLCRINFSCLMLEVVTHPPEVSPRWFIAGIARRSVSFEGAEAGALRNHARTPHTFDLGSQWQRVFNLRGFTPGCAFTYRLIGNWQHQRCFERQAPGEGFFGAGRRAPFARHIGDDINGQSLKIIFTHPRDVVILIH